MKTVNDPIKCEELRKEILYHIKENKYHLDSIRLSLQEAILHLKKCSQHDSVRKELEKEIA